MGKEQKYDESAIERFAGLSGIRKKPNMYIGPSDHNGLWTCWREGGDNTVDRALAGQNKLTHLVYDSQPGKYWVLDAGPGIPVGKKVFEDEKGRKEKLSTLYVVTGLTHAGANFSNKEASRGTHGIGIKATNAMAKSFEVYTYRDGSWWCIKYANAKLVKDVHKSKAPKLPHGIKMTKGTAICFEPDMSLFAKGSKIISADVESWCQLTAYLVPGLEIKVTNAKGKTQSFKSKDGPAEFITARLEELKAEQTGKLFRYTSKELDIAVAFSNAEGSDLLSAYTNGLKNSEGGEHIRALHDSLFKSLDPYKGKSKYTPTDLRDGLIGLVNCKIAAPRFNNQPKDKLIDERVYDVAYPQLLKAWSDFWSKHKSFAKEIIARAALLREKTSEFLKDKKLIKNVNAAKKKMASKLAGVVGNAPVEKRELFIVEGDSAGGGAKKARDQSFQAIYPLKGKPLNVMEASKDKISNNAETYNLLAALGLDLNGKKTKDGSIAIAYGKIILMADADVDGSHIQVLGLGTLYKFTPSLIKNGHVFAVRCPLYRGKKKEEVFFGMTKEEVWKQAGSKVDITYLKGWGEVDAKDLGIALDPSKRTLYRINMSDAKGAKHFEALLGKNPAYRKELFGVE